MNKKYEVIEIGKIKERESFNTIIENAKDVFSSYEEQEEFFRKFNENVKQSIIEKYGRKAWR